jgi:hypothetical protein
MHYYVCMSVRHILNQTDQSIYFGHPSDLIMRDSDFRLCWPSWHVDYFIRLKSAQTLLTVHSIR